MVDYGDFIYIWSYRVVMLLLLITSAYYHNNKNKGYLLIICFALYNLSIYSEYIAYLLSESKSISNSMYYLVASISKILTAISHVLLYFGIVRLIKAEAS